MFSDLKTDSSISLDSGSSLRWRVAVRPDIVDVNPMQTENDIVSSLEA
ncbi:MAG TPA: hypothetical protein VIY68_01730 [Steroidobacteraceae bacterium]